MRSIIRISLFLFIIGSLLTSCSNKAPKEAKYIPKEASFVFVFDPASMEDKLGKGNIHADSAINKMIEHLSFDSSAKTTFDKIKNAGIDWKDKYFVFITQKTVAGGQSTTINILASVKDSAKLFSSLQNIEELKGREVHKEKNYTYIGWDYRGAVSWNDKIVIATFYQYNESFLPKHDSVTKVYYQNNGVNKEEEIKKEVARFYTQKEDESLASQKPFTEMFKDKADGYMFTSTNSAINTLSMMPIQIPKMEELLKDNCSASTFNFEDGQIVFKSASYTNKLLSAILNKYAGPTVNLSMIENYPSQNINGVMLASFNPEIFGAFLKQLEVESMADLFLQNMKLTSADLYKCLKGDIAFVISDYKAPVGAKLIFNATVGDSISLRKIADKLVEQGFLLKTNNLYTKSNTFPAGAYIRIDNKNIIAASDSLTYAEYITKASKAKISDDVKNEFKGKSTAFYINIESIVDSFSDLLHGNDTASVNTVKGLFKDVIATSSNFDGTKVSSEFKIRMKDEKQNSLVSIINLFTKLSENFYNTVTKSHPTNYYIDSLQKHH